MRRPSGDQHWSHRYPERVARGTAHPCAKLSADQVEEISASFAQFGTPCAELGRQFGVSRITIWRHLKAAGLI